MERSMDGTGHARKKVAVVAGLNFWFSPRPEQGCRKAATGAHDLACMRWAQDGQFSTCDEVGTTG